MFNCLYNFISIEGCYPFFCHNPAWYRNFCIYSCNNDFCNFSCYDWVCFRSFCQDRFIYDWIWYFPNWLPNYNIGFDHRSVYDILNYYNGFPHYRLYSECWCCCCCCRCDWILVPRSVEIFDPKIENISSRIEYTFISRLDSLYWGGSGEISHLSREEILGSVSSWFWN